MINCNNSFTKTSDIIDNQFLSRLALEGSMAGLGVGGIVSLAYMLAETLKDKARAEDKRKEVEELSPYLATSGSPKMAEDNEEDDYEDDYTGLFGPIKKIMAQGGRGAVMVPAAATSILVPAWFAYKFLQDRYSGSRVSQLERELEVARQDFRDALAGDTELSADIDNIIDEYKESTHRLKFAEFIWRDKSPYLVGQAESPRTADETFGKGPGLAAGTVSVTALLAAYLSYKLLDKTIRSGHPQTQALRAMKELQKRRKALSGISPYIHIDQDEDGQLVPRM